MIEQTELDLQAGRNRRSGELMKVAVLHRLLPNNAHRILFSDAGEAQVEDNGSRLV